MQGNKDLQNGTASIKVEPGTSKLRLPSLKPPRDLSLAPTRDLSMKSPRDLSKPVSLPGGNQSKKTVYMPRLNVKRNRPQEASLVTVKQEPKESKQTNNVPERSRGRGKRAVIQSSGIFGEGLAPSLKATRYSRFNTGSSGDGPSDKATLQMPKLSKQENITINKEEEDMMLKELLRDDFVDDPNLDPDYENCPIKLPLSKSSIFSKSDFKKIKTEPGTVGAGDGNHILPGDIKIKIEPGLEDDIKDKLTEIKLDGGLDTRIKKEKEDKDVPTIREVMQSKERQFVMLQLPSCLPGLKPEVETNTRQNQPAAASQSNGPTTSNSNSSTEPAAPQKGPDPRCTLQTLNPGKIGKMQILKSGRVRLVLGETKLWLEMGTQVSFKQDLISVDLDKNNKTGKTICMGSVPLRMTVTPDWEDLISSRTMS